MSRIRLVLLALALGACSYKPEVVEPRKVHGTARSSLVYVVSHGWHTGLIVPAAPVNGIAPELADRFGAVRYYEIGWGDKGFYQAQEITTGLSLQAMLWSVGTILHVVAVPEDPRRQFAGSEILQTCVSDAELASLRAFLASSFARDSRGRVFERSKGIYGDSQFYDGEGRYHLLNTCNTWTAKALRSAGLEIDPGFKLTARSVMDAVRSKQRPCDMPATDRHSEAPDSVR